MGFGVFWHMILRGIFFSILELDCPKCHESGGIEVIVVPHDPYVYQYDCAGKPITQFPKESSVRKALHNIVQKLGL